MKTGPMSIRGCSILVLVLIQLQFFAAGQNPQTQNTDNGSGSARAVPAGALSGVMGVDTQVPEGDTSSDLPQIPALLGGPGMSLAFPAEQERSNYLRGGLNVGAAYDDNALLVSSGAKGNTAFSVFPNIALEQTVPRMRWRLGYAAGLTVNERLSSRNQGSHDLSFDSQFRLSPHVNLRIAEDFSLTTGFFDSGNGSGFTGGNGVPNASLITPLAKQRASLTVAEVNYHFALKDLVGASGSFYDLHFSDAAPGATLLDTRTAAGSAFWFHGLFRHDWAGVSYRFDRLTFDPNGETRVHSFMVVNSYSLSSRFTLTGFIGPEYSDNRGFIPVSGGQASHFSDWSVAGGVEVSWQKEHTSVATGYSRRISDGGGVLGAVRLQGVHGDVRQQLFPGWAVALGVSYGNNESLTVPFAASARSVNATSVGASLERNIGKSLALRVGYAHDFQEQLGSADPLRQGGAHRNRVSVTLGYQWAKPLGR